MIGPPEVTDNAELSSFSQILKPNILTYFLLVRIMVSMPNVLKLTKRIQIVSALTEGNGIRATARMVGCSKNTVAKLLAELGYACAFYQDAALRDLPCKRIQADEIWSYVAKKQKNVRGDEEGWAGDVWTWTAICAETKLCVSYLIGSRDSRVAREFMEDVASRLANRVQLTTDGHKPYLEAVDMAFGGEIDYAMLQKHYGEDPQPQKRYSPAKCIGASKEVISGDPDPAHINTSYVERQNLTMRMSMRRFTRLTNAFSKKLDNHAAAISLYFMHYNFCRAHRSLRTETDNRVTPAMAAGIAKSPWSIEDLIGLL